MLEQLYYHVTISTDPYHNLALEEYLMTKPEPGQCILYLWQNRHTVVIGRNQNAWAECRVGELEQTGGHLARRRSGGGAVYHDLGNLNFTFLARRSDYDVDRQLSVICHAAATFGLDARKTGRNDVEIGGRKFSGNAFYKTGDFCCHHGTLLVSADMSQLSRFLQVSQDKLNAKGVASVRARVINLSELCQAITVDSLSQQLIKSFGEVYGLEPKPLSENLLDTSAISSRTDFFASWPWRFGARLPFNDQVQARFEWGGVTLSYEVNEGEIKHLQLYSDGLEADFLAALPEKLQGCRFQRQALDGRAAGIFVESEHQRTVLNDCVGLLKSQIE